MQLKHIDFCLQFGYPGTMEIISILFSILTFVLLAIWFMMFMKKHNQELEVEILNQKWDGWKWELTALKLPNKDFKSLFKDYKKAIKTKENVTQKNLYVLTFHGDIRASQVEPLKHEITAILLVAKPEEDEILIRLESSGGAVQHSSR